MIGFFWKIQIKLFRTIFVIIFWHFTPFPWKFELPQVKRNLISSIITFVTTKNLISVLFAKYFFNKGKQKPTKTFVNRFFFLQINQKVWLTVKSLKKKYYENLNVSHTNKKLWWWFNPLFCNNWWLKEKYTLTERVAQWLATCAREPKVPGSSSAASYVQR